MEIFREAFLCLYSYQARNNGDIQKIDLMLKAIVYKLALVDSLANGFSFSSNFIIIGVLVLNAFPVIITSTKFWEHHTYLLELSIVSPECIAS